MELYIKGYIVFSLVTYLLVYIDVDGDFECTKEKIINLFSCFVPVLNIMIFVACFVSLAWNAIKKLDSISFGGK